MVSENFNVLVEQAMRQGDLSYMRPAVEKEILHYDILFALDKEGLLDHIVFQGGTALRLCYGGQRLSEDLDFAGGVDFKATDLMNMKQCIESYIGGRYGLEISLKEPGDMDEESERQGIKVNKWQIRIVTSPGRPDIPKQMIKIEVAQVPAYTAKAKALISNYEFLPDGYSDTLILVEDLNELMADKLIAFPACQRYVRYRDLWDLQWMKKQGAILNIDLVKQKIVDYRVSDYSDHVSSMIQRLPEIVHGSEFKAQMSRFIPLSVQEGTLKKEKFYDFLENEILNMLLQVQNLA